MSPIRRTLSTAARAFLALPVGLAAAALTLTGRPGRAARLQARFTGGEGWTGGRVLTRALLGLPLDTAAFVLLGYSLFNSVRNLAYPLWYGNTDYHQAWGGPTLAGRLGRPLPRLAPLPRGPPPLAGPLAGPGPAGAEPAAHGRPADSGTPGPAAAPR
ncbi:hypothetical protein O1L60_21980 [Streptomyces diastatochromogenes]|nr:hypothetical protein [Streptomyces diastatochromogenes]